MRCRVLSTALAVSVAGFVACVPALAYDAKTQAPAATCVAYAPDTTASELQFMQAGIYNPGSAIEKVLCSIPRDQEDAYGMNQMGLTVNYRVVSGTPGRLTCTLFVGSAQHQTEPVVTTTDLGPLVANGTRSYAYMVAGVQVSETAPVNVVCAISPKTWMSRITVEEFGGTGPT